jgi:hypothetical protein
VGKKVLNIDFLADFPQAKALLELMGRTRTWRGSWRTRTRRCQRSWR